MTGFDDENGYLDRKICPGCGRENPESTVSDYFSCSDCEWEHGDELATIRGMIDGGFPRCNEVNLSMFLRTLFRRGK